VIRISPVYKPDYSHPLRNPLRTDDPLRTSRSTLRTC
jgi:hypothetical protein